MTSFIVHSNNYYQHDVWYAQRTAAALKRYVEAAQPDASKRVLMTQSLGNMVACEALREGLHVAQYYMFDAAVPSEAVDGTLRAETSADGPFTKYVPEDWRGYTNACWAANWHRLFAGRPGDARARMGWANRFQDALANATEVYNYYSSGDGVFAETDDVPALLDDAVWQECDLQSDETKSVRYSPAGASAALACGSIMNRPVFSVMDAAEMMNANATEDDVFLALAKYVPAVSSAVGGRAVANVRKCSDQSK